MSGSAIQDYALIGDGRSTALVSATGSIDWLCWPRFESSSLFGALLDAEDRGFWRISPTETTRIERRYLGNSAVLETRFHTPSGMLLLTDCMPVTTEAAGRDSLRPEHEILRTVTCEQGAIELEMRFNPRPGYQRMKLRLQAHPSMGIRAKMQHYLLLLRSSAPMRVEDGHATARLHLRAGETAEWSLTLSQDAPAVIPPMGDRSRRAIGQTLEFWEKWVAQCRYDGPYADAVRRSAITLKLLSYAPSGAIVAAPTTSLPEKLGGSLNWDYRYCWLRDASFTTRALLGLGFEEEGEAFVTWLLHATRMSWPKLQVLYDVYGRPPVWERALTSLLGYRQSRPVRVGNAAQKQHQLDVYGEVIDAAAQLLLRKPRLCDSATASFLIGLGNYVCRHWMEPDHGIWETRAGSYHHVHSLVLCWVALDRLIDLSERGILARVPLETFRVERGRIRDTISNRGWNTAIGSFVRSAEDKEVDASLLLMAAYRFLPPDAPELRQTYDRICIALSAGHGLFYRNLDFPEGAFAVCTAWASEYLARGGGTLEEARSLFESLLRFGNDVGLFAEEVDPISKRALGNFPLAFTHIGIINAALAIAERERAEFGCQVTS